MERHCILRSSPEGSSRNRKMLPQKLRCKSHSTVRNPRPHSAGTVPTFFVSSAPHGLRPGLRIRSMRHIASDGWNGTADTSRMLKKASSCVLASLESSTYGNKYVSCSRSLRPCWKTFLNILQAFCQGHGSCCPQTSPSTERVFQHPARSCEPCPLRSSTPPMWRIPSGLSTPMPRVRAPVSGFRCTLISDRG